MPPRAAQRFLRAEGACGGRPGDGRGKPRPCSRYPDAGAPGRMRREPWERRVTGPALPDRNDRTRRAATRGPPRGTHPDTGRTVANAEETVGTAGHRSPPYRIETTVPVGRPPVGRRAVRTHAAAAPRRIRSVPRPAPHHSNRRRRRHRNVPQAHFTFAPANISRRRMPTFHAAPRAASPLSLWTIRAFACIMAAFGDFYHIGGAFYGS